MFVPTIKYKKVNAEKDDTEIIAPSKPSTQTTCLEKQQHLPSAPNGSQTSNELAEPTLVTTFEEKDDATITVDPSDDERILITMSDGKTQYTADRYCPHAGADLSYLGQVSEDEYPPEVGPIVLCTLHYWEFALKRAGRSANGVATINVCPLTSGSNGKDGDPGSVTCHSKNKLDW